MSKVIESYVEIVRGREVFVVDNGDLNYFRSARAANEAFPGSFDVEPSIRPDDIDDEGE